MEQLQFISIGNNNRYNPSFGSECKQLSFSPIHVLVQNFKQITNSQNLMFHSIFANFVYWTVFHFYYFLLMNFMHLKIQIFYLNYFISYINVFWYAIQ